MAALLLLFILGTAVVSSLSPVSVKIENPQSSLVLDGSDNVVKMQRYTGNNNQLWWLLPTKSEHYVIANKGTWKVLDVTSTTSGAKVITSFSNDSPTQKWYFNYDGTLVNVHTNLAVDIQGGWLLAGSPLIMYQQRATNNQMFRITSVVPGWN